MSVTQELANILGEVSRPGDYYTTGRVEVFPPRIEIKGVGTIALPLLPAQARQLIKAATRAPYGRGPDTVVDTKVRRTWQIEAERISIDGKHWSRTLGDIVTRAAEGLGVVEPVVAELYKLLVYDKGSFFVGHRDTEKSPGMFATLVLALPSQSVGGELVVRHNDRESRLDLACAEPSDIAFAAFYADCVHEVLPVTSGCRATLVFNLVRKGKGEAQVPPSYEAEATQVETLLRRWAEARTTRTDAACDDAPEKLVYPLEHAYTPAELAFDKLKGADAAVARLLATATTRAGCDIHLALLTVWESGSAEYVGNYRRRYRRSWHDEPDEDESDDHNEFEVIEVLDGSKSLSEWRRPDHAPSPLIKLPIKDDEVSPPDALENMEPDEEHFREATGNEGASFDRTYARAALVVWPSARILAVLNQAGLETTLHYLAELLAGWKASGSGTSSPLRGQARELAQHMIASWPQRTWIERDCSESTAWGRMLQLLADLGDAPLVKAMTGLLLAQKAHAKADNDAIIAALGIFPTQHAADLLESIVSAHAVEALGACAALLANALRSDALKAAFVRKPSRLAAAARTLVDALPGDPASAPQDEWGRPLGSRPDVALVVDLVGMVDRVDADLARRAAANLLGWPRHYDPDAVLIPAVKLLIKGKRPGGPAFKALHAATVAHLKTRVAAPLEAPRDWARPGGIGCRCEHCTELARFLADSTTESWTLRAAERFRGHVESEIRRASADVDTRTERRGSPHSLVCRKNQASYDRRVAQRKQDLADLATLRSL
jgi:predicted 2-oxoglutarate/Fe(II)-dependent dioxygenase YbiX